MKALALLLALIFAQSSIAGLPPTSLKGQQGSKFTNFNFEVPGNQATKTSTGGLIETGNANLLTNANFEHATVDTGWTLTTTDSPFSGMTETTDTSIVYPDGGKKSAFLTCGGAATGGTCSYKQEVTTIETAGVVRGCLKISQGSTVSLYSLVNGGRQSELKTEDKSLLDNGKWHCYEIPAVLGSTSSGIEVLITSAAGETPEVYADKMFVGAGEVTGETSNISGWKPYVPTLTGLGVPTDVDFKWRQVGSSIEIKGKFTTGSSTATEARLSLPEGMIASPDIPIIELVGLGARSANPSNPFSILAETGKDYLTIGLFSDGSPLTKYNANSVLLSGHIFSFNATVPIQGLTASTTTYSQQVQSDLEVTNEFSADIEATGVKSNENVAGWLGGNAVISSTSTYTIPFKTGLFATTPNCSADAIAGNIVTVIQSVSATEFVVRTQANSDNTAYARRFTINCQRGEGDFKASKVIKGTFDQLAHVATIKDVKASGTAGGTFTAEAWRTRDLNTLDDEYGIVKSLSGNRFTLIPGRYKIYGYAPAGAVNWHKAKIYNVTSTADEIIGSSEYTGAGVYVSNPSSVHGVIEVATESEFEIQHQCSTSRSTDGLGPSASFSVDNVFTQLFIQRLK